MNRLIKPLFVVIALSAHAFFCFAQDSISTKEATIREEIKKIRMTDVSLKGSDETAIIELDSLYREAKRNDLRDEVASSGVQLMRLYTRRYCNEKVIATGNDVRKYSGALSNYQDASELYRMMGLAYSNLGIMDQSYQAYQTSLLFAGKIQDNDIRHYMLSLSYENLTSYFDNTKTHPDSILYYLTKSLKEAEQMNDQFSDNVAVLKFDMIVNLHSELGQYYMEIADPPQPEMAEKHFLAALHINKYGQHKILRASEVALLLSLAKFYYTRKEYGKAIVYSQRALAIEKKSPAPQVKVNVYNVLARAYMEQGNKDSSIQYMNLFTALNDSLKIAENKGTNTSVEQIIAKEQKSSKQKTRRITGIVTGIALVSLLIIFLLWRRNKIILQNKYERLIEKLNTEKEKAIPGLKVAADDETGDSSFVGITKGATGIISEETEETNEKAGVIKNGKETASPLRSPEESEETEEPHSNSATGSTNENTEPLTKGLASVNISDETLATLLANLEKFERSGRYLKKEINLTSLAHQLNTNPKYLSEIIKQHKGKTFSNYINSLKIGYITHKLYDDAVYREYKVSHLAEVCGFASRQVFVLAFKKETGVTPSYFTSQLKE